MPGVNFMDNAWEYNDHRSEDWMGRALQGQRDKVFLMTKVCTHGRDKKVAMQQLEESLLRLRTDHLDLWQIHEVRLLMTTPNCTSPKTGSGRRCWKPRSRAKCGSSALRATRRRNCICECWLLPTARPAIRHRADAFERLRCDLPQLSAICSARSRLGAAWASWA